ncbi:MAG: c-type cytochrome biogenesis protein CcsB [Candidatus Abyssobacteria bacterium SURF_17]|jgi:cytochrome c-type biogenesis protein CcsB|uniref:C-type cytochrome biogenesis protein CcsB n=1 Tax=Candidatus Abyssobacteria bacterium SURF_17 TaxID=2093361 RepID=A0A419F138_9BACT|nr:MAG: c-type cytochrome biogenesis protein CcsB [Candidatus Abyssubacteria bacterium SURF_17]
MSNVIDTMLRRDTVIIVWELRALWLATALQLLSLLFYLMWLISPAPRLGRTASRILLFSTLLLSGIIIVRTIEAGRPPYQSLYESVLWFSWSTTLAYLIVEKRFGNIFAAGFTVSLIAAVSCLYAALGCDPAVEPLVPALQSDWFIWHVVIAFISYAVFVVAFSIELAYIALTGLFSPQKLMRYGMEPESAARFHRTVHQLVLFGFPLLTLGIVSGSAWAEQAWGRYWSWDPKETWSLITWTVYAVYLHAMTMARWRGGRASAINILGFVCIIMTFLGVNWIAKLFGIPSLHA